MCGSWATNLSVNLRRSVFESSEGDLNEEDMSPEKKVAPIFKATSVTITILKFLLVIVQT